MRRGGGAPCSSEPNTLDRRVRFRDELGAAKTPAAVAHLAIARIVAGLTNLSPGGHTRMAMDLPTLRKLIALDPKDPLSRFALGKKLFEGDPTPASLSEAADHLSFANAHAP